MVMDVGRPLFGDEAMRFAEGGLILEFMADTDPDSDSRDDDLPRYVPVASISAFSHEKEWLFTGKRVKFKITNIYEYDMEKGHRVELAVLNKIQKMLSNGEPKWKEKELEMFQEFCRLNAGTYVLCAMCHALRCCERETVCCFAAI